jgi:cellulose synthase (UDP-forming)
VRATVGSTGRRSQLRLLLIRFLVVLTLALGANYLVWRWLVSVNWSAWPIAVPLILAETYSFIDACLFGLTMWRMRERGPAPDPSPDATVDVFITTYNEPVDLVMATAIGARDIRWPHSTWVLDDGAREEMRVAAEEAGIGYLTRSPDWADKPRHAKAGNLNNALFSTEGEFLLILDADQVPSPDILHRTLGWFDDESVALVQTPQWFHNVDEADVLGSQAPLFYGPIQQGKDGWNAAFFCGSNAVLRREALMQIGVAGYVREVERAVRDALRAARSMLASSRRAAQQQGPQVVAAVDTVQRAATRAQRELKAGTPVAEVTYAFHEAARAASRDLVAADVDALAADLAAIQEVPFESDRELDGVVVDPIALDRLAAREWSPLGALESVGTLVDGVDVIRGHEAQPVMPMATISVTEDMATAMRLHAAGWRTVYHHEVLAHGLAPEDAGSMLHQRLRWAQGTLQVMLRENPLVQRGLSAGQRLMYLATMWSYLSGFAAVAYIAAPISYFVLGVLPVTTLGTDFMIRLVPFLIANQILFAVIGWRVKTWRGQQYSLALFPLWIRACVTAAANVWFGRPLGFVVTPKTRQEDRSVPWHLIRPQLVAMALLVASSVVGVLHWSQRSLNGLPTLVNLVWIVYDLAVLGIVVRAVRLGRPARASWWSRTLPAAVRPRTLAALGALLVVAISVGLLSRLDQDSTGRSTAGSRSATPQTSPGLGADTGGEAPDTARAESIVHTHITRTGVVEVNQAIRFEQPLSRLRVRLPRVAGSGGPGVVAQVIADGRTLEAVEVGRRGRVIALDDPARQVVLRYRLHGYVDRSPDAPGRALVRAVALEVDEQPRPVVLTVSGAQVLNVACMTRGTRVPQPCGQPVKDAWRVVARSKESVPSLQAQVNLG